MAHIAPDLRGDHRAQGALRMMTAFAIHRQLQIMRGPRGQRVRKAHRDVRVDMPCRNARGRFSFVRHAQTTGIVARGAINLGMLGMFRRAAPFGGVVTIGALDRLVVRAMALCA